MNIIITAMSLFTSDRERRLWLWTLAVVVAIYSTLGLAGTLAGALREQGARRGVASLCIGGGEATAMAIEMV